MGSGKTQYMTQQQQYGMSINKHYKTLIVSSRKTYTDSIAVRFAINHNKVCIYNETMGQLSFDDTDVIVCQVESLIRITDICNVDLLILDEIESILTQCGNSLSLKGKSFSTMISSMNYAKQCLVLDAHL